MLVHRYTGHVNKGYKLDCCLSDKDTHVLSCSEDGYVYYWDLVEVSILKEYKNNIAKIYMSLKVFCLYRAPLL